MSNVQHDEEHDAENRVVCAAIKQRDDFFMGIIMLMMRHMKLEELHFTAEEVKALLSVPIMHGVTYDDTGVHILSRVVPENELALLIAQPAGAAS